jgi:hypothetical protein
MLFSSCCPTVEFFEVVLNRLPVVKSTRTRSRVVTLRKNRCRESQLRYATNVKQYERLQLMCFKLNITFDNVCEELS